MGRLTPLLAPSALAALVALAALACAQACGGTVTNIGSVTGDSGADGAPAAPSDAGPHDDGGDEAEAAADGGGTDAHAACPTSQCNDVSGAVLCEGAQGHRACPDGHNVEGCTCGGTAPSHWTNCGGCP